MYFLWILYFELIRLFVILYKLNPKLDFYLDNNVEQLKEDFLGYELLVKAISNVY